MYHKAYGLKYKSIKLSKQLTMSKEAKYEKKALKSHQFRKENSFLRKADMKFLPTNRASCQKFCSFFLGCLPYPPNSILIHFILIIQDLSNQKLSYCCFFYSIPECPSHSLMTSKKNQHTTIFCFVFSFSHHYAIFSQAVRSSCLCTPRA